MAAPGGPVVCFSYLATADLWQAGSFPKPNHGAEVRSMEHSVAADGPMVAAVLAALDQPSLLLANDISDDPQGKQVSGWLARHEVRTTAAVRADSSTPRITIVGDDRHTRTMFPHLPGVADDLNQIDLTPLTGAAFAYVDGYPAIGKAAARATGLA
jgi:sugar/nucleoside kinase (ribokinase family)